MRRAIVSLCPCNEERFSEVTLVAGWVPWRERRGFIECDLEALGVVQAWRKGDM